MNRALTHAVVMAAAGSLLLTSCGGGDSKADESTPSPSPSSTVSVPESVALTEPGTELAFGEAGSVIFEADQRRGTVLELTVTKATKGTVKDFSSFIVDDYTKASTPYYVNVTVRNTGEGDVGGAAVPLWGVDGENTLLPAASFTTDFGKCDSDPLPDKFAAGAALSTCLVYLAPEKGTLEAVSFRPTQEFDPVSWTGTITTPKPEPKPTKKATPKKKKPAKKKR